MYIENISDIDRKTIVLTVHMQLSFILMPLISLVLCGQATAFQEGQPYRDSVITWLEQCWEYRFNNPDSARFYGRKALELSQRKQNQELEAEAWHNLGVTYEAQADYEEALKHAMKALGLRREIGDDLKTAHTLNNIGIIYDQQGNFTQALSFYREAYAIYKRLDDKEKLAMVDINLGILFKAQGEYDKVIGYYREAYEVYKKLNMPAEIAFCEANLGSVYYYTKQYDSCIYYSERAEKAFTVQNNLQFLPVAQCNAGLGYLETGRLTEAKAYLQKALAGHRNYRNRKEAAFVLTQLATLYGKEGNREDAFHAAAEAKMLAEEVHAPQQVMDASRVLADTYAARKDFQKAYGEQLLFTAIRDSLFEQEKMKTLANFQTRYETEKKEQKITLLNRETTIQKLQLRQQGFLLLAAGSFICVGIASGYLMIRQRKLRAEARLQQELHKEQERAAYAVLEAEERERRRIAGDLHDGVGQMMSTALMKLNEAREKTPEESQAGALTARALALLSESYDEMRHISHQMMPNALLKAGLSTAIKEFVDKIDGSSLKVDLTMEGLQERLGEQTETVIYRVIQEAVNNVVKHAGATRLSIQLTKDTDGLAVTIEDNGHGFDTAILDEATGIGVRNIYSRLALLKGTLEIDSAPGRGTAVTIFIPAG